MDARVIVSYNIPAFEGWKNLLNCMLVKGRLGMLILPSDLFLCLLNSHLLYITGRQSGFCCIFGLKYLNIMQKNAFMKNVAIKHYFVGEMQ